MDVNVLHSPKALVVGAGPVGCLSAIALANLGWHVTIYERRSASSLHSLRLGTKGNPRQRSINLTLSARGIAAVQAIDSSLVERLLHNAVPLRGRMVHCPEGIVARQQYDRGGHCLYSIERGLLNTILLEAAASVKNINIQFLHKVQDIDFNENTLRLYNLVSGQEFDDHFELCLGADGSHSVIRHHLMQATLMEYSQHYLSHEYVEIRLPHGVDASGHHTFLLDPHHLHVWPRGNFTMVAMPNKNKTFTCALFAPKSVFETLQYPDTLLPWFKTHFPDLLSLMGEKHLVLELQSNPRSHLITTKANKFTGDAAHSMVPFYGQGLNCALEDVRILSVLLAREKDGHDPAVISRVLSHYSESRHEDLVAICDLAMDSHLKMRHSVATWSYMIRAFIDNILYAITETGSSLDLSQAIFAPKVPSGWIPLYSMVSFRPDISYSAAKKKAERQERLIDCLGIIIGILAIGCVCRSFLSFLT
ncbi:FAD/NAD-P-binding domain-containing protein [Mycena capillaripes]|nr:FAD/NAD-P-binding domain-containing protein [Mycena capillaripes]